MVGLIGTLPAELKVLSSQHSKLGPVRVGPTQLKIPFETLWPKTLCVQREPFEKPFGFKGIPLVNGNWTKGFTKLPFEQVKTF